jgi:hypothetical protein
VAADKATLDLEIRLQAIEFVLTQIGKVALITAGFTVDQAAEMRKNAREGLLKETFPGADPAMADHVSAEFADRVEFYLKQIEYLVAEAYRKAATREHDK